MAGLQSCNLLLVPLRTQPDLRRGIALLPKPEEASHSVALTARRRPPAVPVMVERFE